MEQLADEKLVLAQRVVDLISRARAKLDHELSRVLIQQGEDPNSAPTLVASSVSAPRRNALQEVKETLRTPRETTPVVSVVPTPTQVAGNKSEVFPQWFSFVFLRALHRETGCWRNHDQFNRLWQPCTLHWIYRDWNPASYPPHRFRLQSERSAIAYPT